MSKIDESLTLPDQNRFLPFQPFKGTISQDFKILF
jgi:hypothetical protein